ncbi:MAG: MlaD family protein [Bdellovibrionota bacterium]|nr:MlaD family protein [Bdellovibrionota bacterium]
MDTNKKALLIGIFIVFITAIFIMSVGVLGSGSFFTNKVKYIMYFNDSVKGLKKGAKVAFKGVTVGEVHEINIVLNQASFEAVNQVVVQIDRNRLKSYDDRLFDFGYGVKKMTQKLIKKGLKAQLQMESIVTGVLMINLDFDNKFPSNFVDKNGDYIEIPTLPSGLSQITQTLNKIPLDHILSKFSKILDNLEKVTSNDAISNIIDNLDKTIKNLENATNEVNSVFKKVDVEILPIMKNLDEMVKEAKETFIELKDVTANLNDMSSDDSKFRYDLEKTMEALTRASKSVETLTDYLNRNPNAIIFGK